LLALFLVFERLAVFLVGRVPKLREKVGQYALNRLSHLPKVREMVFDDWPVLSEERELCRELYYS